jgi:peroxiredoxin
VAALERDLSKFESRNTQVVGISTDFPMAQKPWAEKMGLTYPLVSDWQRKVLPGYGILDTDPNSMIYRYAKRAYLIIDRDGIVRWKKILDDPRQALTTDELLAAVDKVNGR